jgi:hypothetical protein
MGVDVLFFLGVVVVLARVVLDATVAVLVVAPAAVFVSTTVGVVTLAMPPAVGVVVAIGVAVSFVVPAYQLAQLGVVAGGPGVCEAPAGGNGRLYASQLD